jgi:thioesterase domain-containing protein
LTTIEAMAARYIDEIRTVQPEGPYVMGGMSFGGRVAFEMAHRLRAQGHDVALLALFDTYGPELRPSSWRNRHRVEFHLTQLERRGPRAKLGYVLDRCLWVAAGMAYDVSRATGVSLLRPSRHVALANGRASRRFFPDVYPGRVTLFRAQVQPRRYRHDPQLGWGGLATGGLEIHEVPGDHFTMWEQPHVRVLAERLRAQEAEDRVRHARGDGLLAVRAVPAKAGDGEGEVGAVLGGRSRI